MDKQRSFAVAGHVLWAVVLLGQSVVSYSVASVAKLLRCDVGFDLADAALRVLTALLLSFVPLDFSLRPPIFPVGFVWVCVALLLRFAGSRFQNTSWRGLRHIVCACLVGCACSEAWLLFEEWRFSVRVHAERPAAAFVSRSWPFEGFGLLYNPERGIWAVD